MLPLPSRINFLDSDLGRAEGEGFVTSGKSTKWLRLLPRWWQPARFFAEAITHLSEMKVFYSFKYDCLQSTGCLEVIYQLCTLVKLQLSWGLLSGHKNPNGTVTRNTSWMAPPIWSPWAKVACAVCRGMSPLRDGSGFGDVWNGCRGALSPTAPQTLVPRNSSVTLLTLNDFRDWWWRRPPGGRGRWWTMNHELVPGGWLSLPHPRPWMCPLPTWARRGSPIQGHGLERREWCWDHRPVRVTQPWAPYKPQDLAGGHEDTRVSHTRLSVCMYVSC